MGTELMEVCVKGENDEIPSVPPGFESFASFSLKRVQDEDNQETENVVSCSSVESNSDPKLVKMETESCISDAGEVTRSLRRKPCRNYGQLSDDGLDEESSSLKYNQSIVLALSSRSPLKSRLPKGVIRGCPQCSTCQKVNARWHPEQARKPDLEDAPVFYPTEEEFEDTLNYIASIRPKAEPYGICRIVPPPSWKPPCPLREKAIWESSKFVTRVQRVDKLQNRDSMSKMSKIHNIMRKKRRRCMRMTVECGTGSEIGTCEPEFGFERGPEFTLHGFQKYADEFKAQYFRKDGNVMNKGGDTAMHQDNSEPTLENIEGEYWRIVEKATEEIEVLYGADLETGVFGSGFPKMSGQVGSATDERYTKSGWNLNNFPRLPGSVLSYESGDISGVLVPWLYIGMCFSSFCWHVEDHHLYSLNYMHWGAPKMWYGVPGKNATKLEEAMRKHLPDLFEEQPDLLHKLVTQLSPSILKSGGLPVYRCVQSAGEFVLTFPRAYHAGFNCGFNCAEAVNVAPVDWLPHGQIAVDLYRYQGRKTSISHDKILLGAAREAVRAHWELNLLKKNTVDNLRWKEVCGKDGILAKTLKERVDMERTWREVLCHSSQALKMESNFDTTSERECSFCLFDLHLSAAGCRCSPDKYTCLKHAKQLCSCVGDAKFFLFRYDILELNILVEALEGKLSAVYRWAKLDLGLALTSYISKSSKQDDKLSYTAKAAASKQAASQSSVAPITDIKMTSGGVTAAKDTVKLSAAAPLNDMKPVFGSHSSLQVMDVKNDKSMLTKEAVSQEGGVHLWKYGAKKQSTTGQEDVILLSDDENDDQKETVIEIKKEVPSAKHPELSEKLVNSGDKVAAVIDAAVINRGMDEHLQNGTDLPSNRVNRTCYVASKTGRHCSTLVDTSSMRECGQDHNMGNPGTQNPQQSCRSIVNATVTSVEGSRQIASPSCSQNNLDRIYRQKGPRVAKVVRRITCNVEPLELGSVCSGKCWCNSQAIFPKGFRSRVRYISVSDPANTCNYVSEIVDGGRNGPLFMVSLEDCPSEAFIHVSASRCWEMVRERVNQEIAKQHKLGKLNLPPLQPPGSLDGLEMFGFSSPAIVQAIEALDRNRICAEYWDSRPYSRPLGHVPQLEGTIRDQNTIQSQGTDSCLVSTLGNLFKKASQDELYSLSRVVNDNRPTADNRGLITRLLNEEIRNRSQ